MKQLKGFEVVTTFLRWKEFLTCLFLLQSSQVESFVNCKLGSLLTKDFLLSFPISFKFTCPSHLCQSNASWSKALKHSTFWLARSLSSIVQKILSLLASKIIFPTLLTIEHLLCLNVKSKSLSNNWITLLRFAFKSLTSKSFSKMLDGGISILLISIILQTPSSQKMIVPPCVVDSNVNRCWLTVMYDREKTVHEKCMF